MCGHSALVHRADEHDLDAAAAPVAALFVSDRLEARFGCCQSNANSFLADGVRSMSIGA